MKIAIFHNLEKGGALNSIIYPLKYLYKSNHIDVYSFKKNIPEKFVNNFFTHKLKTTNNIFEHIFQILFELKNIHKKISEQINKNNYDLVLIFPCILTQSPYLLRFVNNSKNNCLYFFNETKREFYEDTSYDHYSIKKIITRLIRIPIKIIDKNNCRKAKNIIANSIYTANILKTIYNKNCTVIYPGLKPITPKKIIVKNNKKILSVGLFSKIKGHDFSIQQLKNLNCEITILGRKTNEYTKIINFAQKNNINLKTIHTENNKEKNKLFKKHSIYIANQQKEPFGITTLEATNYNCFVLGKNEGGTPEIIKHGLNGFLYPNDISIARNSLKKILKQKQLALYKQSVVDWKYTTNSILQLYHSLKNESAE